MPHLGTCLDSALVCREVSNPPSMPRLRLSLSSASILRKPVAKLVLARGRIKPKPADHVFKLTFHAAQMTQIKTISPVCLLSNLGYNITIVYALLNYKVILSKSLQPNCQIFHFTNKLQCHVWHQQFMALAFVTLWCY